MGALDFARSSFIGAGMGVQGDRVFLVAARAGEIDQDVEWRGFCLRGLPGRVVMAVRRLLHFLSGTLSGVQELIGACEHFLRALAYFNLVRWYGDVPLLEHEVKSLTGLKVSRTPAAQLYGVIVQDLQNAIATLPASARHATSAAGRVR